MTKLEDLEQQRQAIICMQDDLAIEYDHELADRLSRKRRYYIIDMAQFRASGQEDYNMQQGWDPTLEELAQQKAEITQMENDLAIEYDHELENRLSKARRWYIMDYGWYRIHHEDAE